MAGRPGQFSEEGGDVREQVQETFADDFTDNGDQGEGDDGGDDSQGEGEGDTTRETEGDVEGLPNFEQFLRDTEVKDNRKPAKDGQQQEEQPRTRPDRYEQDQRGNVIDPRTGKVLARAGAEARLYMDSRRAKMDAFQAGRERDELRGHLQQAVGFIQQYRSQLAGIREANSQAERLGVTPSEISQGVEFIARLKKGGTEGIQAIKEILTRAAAAGMDVQSLGVGAGGIDVKAIIDQIRQEFAPIRSGFEQARLSASQQEQEQIRRQNAYNNAAEITYSFFAQNEDALPYAPVIEKALRDPRYRGWTIREVWQQLQLHLAKRAGNGSANGQGNHRGMEIPRGGRNPSGGQIDQEPLAHPDQSFADLVNQILDEHGMQ
jgi:hypothetical protein